MAINKSVNIKINISTGSFESQLKKSQGSFTSFLTNIKNTAVGFAVGDILANQIRQFGAAIAQSGKDLLAYDQQLKVIQKTSNLTSKSVEAMGAEFLALSKTIPTSVKELNDIAGAAGQLGIKGKAAIAGFTKEVARISTALDLGAEETATSLAKIANAAGFNLSETPGIITNIASSINELSNTSAASAGDIIQALRRIGGAGNELGVTVDQAAALSTALIDIGLPAEEAGTALKNTFIFAATKAEEFGKVIGMTAAETRKALAEDGVGSIQKFITALGDAENGTERLAITSEIFGTRSGKAISGLSQNAEKLKTTLATASEAFAQGISIQKEYAVQVSGASAQFDILKNSLTGTVQQILVGFLPVIKESIVSLSSFIQSLNSSGQLTTLFKNTIDGLSAAFTFLADNAKLLISVLGGLVFYKKIASQIEISNKAVVRSFMSITNGVKSMVTSTISGVINIKSRLLTLKSSIKSVGISFKTQAATMALSFKKAVTNITLSSIKAKLSFQSIKLGLLSAGTAVKGFAIKAKTAMTSFKVALKLASVSVKLFKAGLSFGLSIAIDMLIEKFIMFKEEVGGFGNALTVIFAEVKKSFFSFTSSIITRMASFLSSFSKIPIVGERVKAISDSLKDFGEGLEKKAEASKKALIEVRKEVGKTSTKIKIDDKALLEEMAAKSAETIKKADSFRVKSSATTINTIKKQQTDNIFDVLGIKQDASSKALIEELKLMAKRNKIDISGTKATEIKKQQTSIQTQDKLLQLEKMRLDQEFNLVESFEEKKLKLKINAMEAARQKEMASSKKVASAMKANLVDMFSGGKNSIFSQLGEEFGQGTALAAAGGSALGSVGKGAQGAKDLIGGGLKAGAVAVGGPLGEAAGPLIDMLMLPTEELRSTIQEFSAAIPEVITTILENIPVIVEELIMALPDIAIGLIDALVEGVPRLIETFIAKIPELIKGLVREFPRLVSSLISALVPQMPTIAIELAKLMPTVAITFATEMVKQAPRIVTEIVKGLGKGVKSVFSGIGGSISSGFGLFATGGVVPTGYNNDSYPALLTSGERVLSVEQTKAFERMVGNNFNSGNKQSGQQAQSSSTPTQMNQTFNININGAGVQDDRKLVDMVISRIRSESERGRPIMDERGLDTAETE